MLSLIHIEYIMGTIFLLLYFVTTLGLILVIITENRNPLKTIPWVVVLLLAPGLGLLLYLIFGQDNRKQRVISRRTYKRIMKQPARSQGVQDTCVIPAAYLPLATLLGNSGHSPLLYGSRIKVYTKGIDKFHDLLEAIQEAKHHIHIEYYIFNDDEIGRKIQGALIRKAKEGIEVRVIYDDVGCWNVKSRFFKEMKQAGIEVYPFLKVVFPIFSSKVNYRNHRKVAIIDGRIGFIGGMNIADRYVKGVSWGEWRDTHFRVEGKGVQGLQSIFLIDWYVVSKTRLKGKIYYPTVPVLSDTITQIATSGPIGPWRTLLQATIQLIANAKKYIYIQTPYFLPTEGLNQALQIAALSGVDVRLMLPKHSDTMAANIASHSFIDDLVKAGAKIYFYRLGFLHSKLIVCDDYITSVGSANMDFRSFEHNFEINAFTYHREFALRLKGVFLEDMRHCEQLNPTQWFKRPIKQRVSESFMRLFSPLL